MRGDERARLQDSEAASDRVRPARFATLLAGAALLGSAAAGCLQGGIPQGRPGDAAAKPGDLWIVEMDGRTTFPVAPAATLAAEEGASLLGEGYAGFVSTFGHENETIVPFLGADANARALLGWPPVSPGFAVGSVPASAEWASGQARDVRSTISPSPRARVAYEMERLRACDAKAIPVCLVTQNPTDGTRIQASIPANASDLVFQPDVFEVAAGSFPAFWNGSFRAPNGSMVRFRLQAADAGAVPGAGSVPGAVSEGNWSIDLTFEGNGTRAAYVPGFVGWDAREWAVLDATLQSAGPPPLQTRVQIGRLAAREGRLTLARPTASAPSTAPDPASAASMGSAGSTASPALPTPGLLLGFEEAARYAGANTGDASFLVARGPPDFAARFEADSKNLSGLDRNLVAFPAASASWGLPWSSMPAGNDSIVFPQPVGCRLLANGTEIEAGFVAIPSSTFPYTVTSKTAANATQAIAAMDYSPDSVLISADLAPRGEIPGTITLTGGMETRAFAVEGVVAGGPPATIWGSPSLLSTIGPAAAVVGLPGAAS